MEIISKEEAISKGLKRYFTGAPCKHGHINTRLISTGTCQSCDRLASTKYRKTKTIQYRAAASKYYYKNKQKCYIAVNKWKSKNRDKTRAITSKWFKEHPAYANAYSKYRMALKLHRTPIWANKEKIKEFYEAAAKLQEVSLEKIHVDHIIPLQGDLVSGLHVENNLQLLKATENISKKNKFDPVTFCG